MDEESKKIIDAIRQYQNSSDNLATLLDNSRLNREILERVESFCLSYDEHLMLGKLIEKLKS